MVRCFRMTLRPNAPTTPPVEAQAPAKKSPKPRRRRCHNCPLFFFPKKPWQKFCSYQCQRQFHHYGNSYGKLKETVAKLIQQQVKELAPKTIEVMVAMQGARMQEQFEKRLEAVEDRTRRIARQLASTPAGAIAQIIGGGE